MGYRSDVGLALSARVAKDVETPKTKFLLDLVDNKYTDGSGNVLYIWKSIKWYEDTDEDIGALLDILAPMDGEDYLFIEVGETPDHLDYKGYWWHNPFNLGYQQALVFDKPEEADYVTEGELPPLPVTSEGYTSSLEGDHPLVTATGEWISYQLNSQAAGPPIPPNADNPLALGLHHVLSECPYTQVAATTEEDRGGK